MDPLFGSLPTFEDEHLPGFDELRFSSALVELAAQQLLRQIGWSYYTIWQEDIHPLTGYSLYSIASLHLNYISYSSAAHLLVASRVVYRLSWSRGDVIRHSSGGERYTIGLQQSSSDCQMGLALQKFYQQCSSLPLGLGIAGRAIASGHYQWASGNELSQQIRTLGTFNHQPAPPALLQAHGFQTILCIPWKTNAGVLEIGTTTLRDKITTLERTVEYLKEMQGLVHDLQQPNKRLQKIGSSQNVNTTTKALANLAGGLLKNASCEFRHSSKDENTVHPHFSLHLTMQLIDVEETTSIINIMHVLQQKNLQCLDLKTEFHPSSNYLFVKILAQQKDGKNNIPTLAEIEDIKEWWTNHIDNS